MVSAVSLQGVLQSLLCPLCCAVPSVPLRSTDAEVGLLGEMMWEEEQWRMELRSSERGQCLEGGRLLA